MSETTARAIRRATSASFTTAIGSSLSAFQRHVKLDTFPVDKGKRRPPARKSRHGLPVLVEAANRFPVDGEKDVPFPDAAVPRRAGGLDERHFDPSAKLHLPQQVLWHGPPERIHRLTRGRAPSLSLLLRLFDRHRRRHPFPLAEHFERHR